MRFHLKLIKIAAINILIMLAACNGKPTTISPIESTDPVLAYPPPKELRGPYPPPDGNINPTVDYQLPEIPKDIPEPESGMSSISGVIYSYTIHRVVAETSFYFKPVDDTGDVFIPFLVGPLPENGDIIGKSDENGEIRLNDIPPGRYVLVVSAPYNWSIAQISSTDPNLRIINLQPDQKLALEIIYLSWP